jgi:hypothetical protein
LLLGTFLCPAKEVPLPPEIQRQLKLELLKSSRKNTPSGPQQILPESTFAALFEGGIFPGIFFCIDAAKGDVLIQGFQNPVDWVFTNVEEEGGSLGKLVNKQGRWTIKNNAAICLGGNGALLGCNLPGSPQAIRMDFDLRSPQGNPQIGFQFFTDNLTNHRTGHTLDLTFRKGKASAKRQPIDRDAGQNGRIGKPVPLPALGKRAAHITMHASLRPSQLHIAINGEHVGGWESEQPLEQFGAGILFVQRGKQPACIENLVIRKSSGHAPIGRQLPKLPAGLKQNYIIFTNGDHIDGEIKEIKKGIAICKSSFGDIKLPLAKIQLARKALL